MKKYSLLLLIAFILLSAPLLLAQENAPPVDIGKESMYFPHRYQKYHVQTGLGLFLPNSLSTG